MNFSRLSELMDKDAININDGSRIGRVDDVEIDTEKACISALIIYGHRRLFGLLGHGEDTVVPWARVNVIGEDTVLVNIEAVKRLSKPRGGVNEIINMFK